MVLILDGINNLSAKGDYSRLAHIALKNCNVQREKHFDTVTLRQGGGKLLATRGMSNREYSEYLSSSFK